MELRCNKNTAVYLILMLALVANYFIFPSLIVVQLFAGFYLTIIYKKFANNIKHMIYFTTILFAIINFSLEIPLGSRYSIYYFYVTLFIYMICLLYSFIKNNPKIEFEKIKNNKYLMFFIVFVVYMLASVLLAGDKKLAIKYIYNFAIMASLLIMVILENRSKEIMNKTLRFLQYVYTGILGLGILEIFEIRYGTRNHFVEWDPIAAQISYVKKIPVVFFYNPNNYAVFLVIGMTILFSAWLFSKDKNKKMIYLLLYFVSQVNLIFTRSRTAWVTIFITLLFATIFYAFGKNKDKVKTKKLFALGTITMVVFVGISFIPSMQPFYGKITGSKLLGRLNIWNMEYQPSEEDEQLIQLGKKGSTNQRYTLLYDVAHGVFVEKHFLGFGPGNIEKYVEKMDNTFGVVNVHSLWFEILGDFGIPIFFYVIYIYLAMILDSIKAYYHANEELKKYLIMFASTSFGVIFLAFAPSTIMWYPTFWIVVGMTVTLAINNKKFIKYS
ncbi:O-antigen ligase family protein [Clostridium lundense]|uniref:O-antigen ligase family protein n=1 Tax=Clostridium lundense TaxID=319475 RepID=UPI00047F9FFB|nr:O-antigen ligase family protein [Clostridium lundense]